MRIALVDSPHSSCWIDGGHRLHLLGDHCRPELDTVELFAGGLQAEAPVLAACGRETDVRPLIEASLLVRHLADYAPDICVAPLQGGLAHGILMARACGELPASLRVLLVAEEPSRSIALRSDLGRTAVRHLICDAMERFCLERADALLAGSDFCLEQLAALKVEGPPVLHCLGAQLGQAALLTGGTAPSELCFVGPFTRAAGVTTFIEAAEHLFADGGTTIERLVFIGPMPDLRHAPGNEWLGRRAIQWRFPFEVIETTRFADALTHIKRSGAIAFVPDVPSTHRAGIESQGLGALCLEAGTGRDASALRAAIAASSARRPVASQEKESAPAIDVSEAIRASKLRRTQVPVPASLSICVLHKDRPAYLRQAIGSVLEQAKSVDGGRFEVILFDNGSVRQDSFEALDELSAHPLIKIVRQSPALPHSSAMNAMASEASADFMVFLDDDNLMADGGIETLLRACSANVFDVIVSNLFIIEADRPGAVPSAKFAFLGPAATAGLFFNFFGDTCMAFRRGAFEEIGGFFDAKAPSPAPDWVLLARAQAAGLKIGVLQHPAFLYRRDVGRADLNWQKYDQHGLRHLVLSHYGDRYDPALIAKVSQSLMVDYYR